MVSSFPQAELAAQWRTVLFFACVVHTGTVLFYQPGLLYGGSVEHDCSLHRSVGYYLEALIMLAPFMKNPLRAVLKGVTNDPTDPSVSAHARDCVQVKMKIVSAVCLSVRCVSQVDLLKATAVPLMKKFGVDGEGLEIKVLLEPIQDLHF